MSEPDRERMLRLPLEIRTQPDDTTCGPTCLDAVYRFYGDDVPLERVIEETGRLSGGGTLAVFLACHALRRGYRATIYTYNLSLFDPSWFRDGVDVAERLARQKQRKDSAKLALASDAYISYLGLGGALRHEELTENLLLRYLGRSVPLLAGLSATFLYGTRRENGATNEYDDLAGSPSGHFVVLSGYDAEKRRALVADPMLPNPIAAGQYYEVPLPRLIGAIYLGVLTYDANLLVLEPPQPCRS